MPLKSLHATSSRQFKTHGVTLGGCPNIGSRPSERRQRNCCCKQGLKTGRECIENFADLQHDSAYKQGQVWLDHNSSVLPSMPCTQRTVLHGVCKRLCSLAKNTSSTTQLNAYRTQHHMQHIDSYNQPVRRMVRVETMQTKRKRPTTCSCPPAEASGCGAELSSDELSCWICMCAPLVGKHGFCCTACQKVTLYDSVVGVYLWQQQGRMIWVISIASRACRRVELTQPDMLQSCKATRTKHHKLGREPHSATTDVVKLAPNK